MCDECVLNPLTSSFSCAARLGVHHHHHHHHHLQGLIPAVRTSTSRSVLANAKAQLLMALQDEDVGAVLGKKGQTLTQIQQVCVVCL